MKLITSIFLALFCVSSYANDCRPSEKYLEGMALGYASFVEQASKNKSDLSKQSPTILWWVGNGKDDYDYEKKENFGKYFGMSELSSDHMFSDAQKVIKNKNVDVYILAWIDEIKEKRTAVSVIKTSIGVTGWDMAYDGAVALEDTEQSGWELGCSLNLLNLEF